MIKALLIGCGNIGAMYDFESDAVSTYAKAFHLDKEVDFVVFDSNESIAQLVCDRYDVRRLKNIEQSHAEDFDLVVIASPTETHHDYLSRFLLRPPSLVICEKPVDIELIRLRKLVDLYRHARTRVMVNYFRRFQPEIIRLKQRIEAILVNAPCMNIVVTYQRGFHNNASHAIDLLEFLFATQILLDTAQITYSARDEFKNDPTLSLSCTWNGTNLQVVGLAHAEFSLFEVALYFSDRAVFLRDAGNLIEEFSTQPGSAGFYPKLQLQTSQSGVTNNYMVNVVEHAKRLLRSQSLNDNFLESVGMSERILKLLER